MGKKRVLFQFEFPWFLVRLSFSIFLFFHKLYFHIFCPLGGLSFFSYWFKRALYASWIFIQNVNDVYANSFKQNISVHFYEGERGNVFLKLFLFYIFLKESLLYYEIIDIFLYFSQYLRSLVIALWSITNWACMSEVQSDLIIFLMKSKLSAYDSIVHPFAKKLEMSWIWSIPILIRSLCLSFSHLPSLPPCPLPFFLCFYFW